MGIDIEIQIPTIKSQRVLGDEAACFRIIIPGPHIVKPIWFGHHPILAHILEGLRDGLNLGAEALAQLKALLSSDEYSWYQEGRATANARLDYVRERLRLLYVGITRARKELVITWNTGRKGELHPAVPFLELQNFWGEQIDQGMEP